MVTIQPFKRNNTSPVEENSHQLWRKNLADATKYLEDNFSPICSNLIKDEFNKELLHRGLNFRENFSYDVVLKLSDLAKGLGIKETVSREFQQFAVTEKLIGYSSPGQAHFCRVDYF
jgi:hypothetical protein